MTPIPCLTPDENRVLETLGCAWNEYCALPPMHPHDADEFMRAIHAAQNIVLARAAMRSSIALLGAKA